MGQKAKIFACIIFGVAILIVIGIFFTSSPYKPRAVPSSAKMVTSIDEWIVYRSPPERFIVSLPAPPQRAIENVPMPSSEEKIRYDMILSQSKRGTIFLLNIIDYPSSVAITNPEDVLMSAIKEIVGGNQSNQLVKAEKGTFYGLPGIDFVIANPEATIQGRAILKERSLFVISVADHDPQIAQQSFVKLADSFALIEQSA
jgi:hypothetical protein